MGVIYTDLAERDDRPTQGVTDRLLHGCVEKDLPDAFYKGGFDDDLGPMSTARRGEFCLGLQSFHGTK
jgi:hypothetical protein